MDTFPIAMLRWKQEMSGWWGRSLVAELASLQLKVDETLDTLLQNLYWTSSLTIFQMENQGYPPSHLMARRPNVVTHKGPRPPDYVTPSPFHPNAMQFLQMLIEWMYDMSGVSQQGAQAKNPLGAQASGTALMELYDQNSERFSDFETGFGIYRTDLAELQIARAKQIGAERDDFSAKWQDRTMMQRILWKDVDMERDQFVIRLEPSNFIPDTRAGKLATANELGQAGLVPQEYMSEMFSEPDIREANRVQNSPLRYLQWVMQKLGDVELDEDDNVVRQADYIPPDRSMDLELAAKMAVAEQHDAEAEEAPEPIVSRFRRFATATDALLSKMKAEAAAMAPPMPAADVPMDPTMGDPMAGAAQDVGLPPGEAPTALPGEAMPG